MVESHIRNSSLAHSRLVAAKASGGTSGEDIYRLFDRVVGDLGLKGALLDFGAGIGALSSRLHRMGRFPRLTAVDILPRPADLPSSISWICADINDVLPFDDGSFDVIVAAEVIEHLENPRFVARECHRLLRGGGCSFSALLTMRAFGPFLRCFSEAIMRILAKRAIRPT